MAVACSGPPAEEAREEFSRVGGEIAAGPLLSAWSDGDVLIMTGGHPGGTEGVLARYDGEAVSVEAGVADRTLWWIAGPRAGEWYAVGEGGRIVHETDGVRVREDVPTDATLFGVWADEDVAWAVGGTVGPEGTTGEIWTRRDGMWSAFATNLPGAVFKVWDGWFVGDGHAWRLVDDALVEASPTGRLVTVRGRADDDVWAVGGLGAPLVTHWDGAAWSEVDAAALGQPLSGLWTGAGEDVYVAGNFGTAAILRDDTWEVPEVPPTDAHLHAVWRHGDAVYWVGGDLYGDGDGTGVLVRYGLPRASVAAAPAVPRVPTGPRFPGISVAHAREPLRAGAPAPPFTLPDLAGAAHDLATLRGRVVVVNFWASWCAPCLAELPQLDALHTRLDPLGATVLAVTIDRQAGPALGVVRRLGLGMPVRLDARGEVATAWAPPALPTTYLLDRSGVVAGMWSRALGAPELAAIEADVRALLGRP